LGCGISGWGWEDDGWGAVNRNGVLLRFPDGGGQRLRIQIREDGVSVDQIVLSTGVRPNGPLSRLAGARPRDEAPDLPGLRMSGQCFDRSDRDPRPGETGVAEAIADR